jgi:hypothetical protein
MRKLNMDHLKVHLTSITQENGKKLNKQIGWSQQEMKEVLWCFMYINPLPLLFKSLLPGQKGCVFFSGHLNLHAKPETGIPYREKNYNN